MTLRSFPFLAICVALSSCTGSAPAVEGEPPALSLKERWTLRFDQSDVAADFDDIFILGDRVLTVESSTAQVSAFALDDGEALWKIGRRGAGPGEYLQPSQLFGFSKDLVGVVDTRQGRITLLRGDGSVGHMITGERVAGDLTNVCGTFNESMLAVRLPQFEIIRITEQPEAKVLYTLRWPVPIYNETPLLQQGLFAKARNGQCVVYQPRGDFFFAVDGDSLRTDSFHRYAKAYPPQKLDRTQQFPRISPGGFAAGYAVVKDDSIFILRGGIAKEDEGMVDIYLLSTGERVAIATLPAKTYKFDVAGAHLVVLQNTDSGSHLTVYDR